MSAAPTPAVEVEDTYAEGFRSIYAEVLVTARDQTWLDHAVAAATGHASSTILCDCEAGRVRDVDASETPDGRPGAVCQFHVPRFDKQRVRTLELALIARLSQNVLTCPTAAVFDHLGGAVPEQDAAKGRQPYELGRKIGFFGDRFQFEDRRHGRDVTVVPIMGGEFVMDRLFGFADGIMGGNVWFMGESVDAAIDATQAGVDAVAPLADVIMPFPGGIAASGSRAGSSYDFLIASTNAPFCPTLRQHPDVTSELPAGVESVMEIIINGRDVETITTATRAAIDAAMGTPGLRKISAGNYNGRLGKSFIWLREDSELRRSMES